MGARINNIKEKQMKKGKVYKWFAENDNPGIWTIGT